MAGVAGQGTTFNLPNYVGELFRVTPTDTPLLSMIGGLNGGRSTTSKQFTWQTVDNNSAAQSTALEGADPTFENRTRSETVNVVQIQQYGFETSYTKQAATGNLDGEAIIGTQPVQDENAFQLRLKLERAARDVEFSFLEGTYQNPSTNGSARQTRGVFPAITTNTESLSSADLDKDTLDSLMRSMADNGAPFRNVVFFGNAYNRQRVSSIYGYAPTDRNVGGVAIKTVEADFVTFGVSYNRHLTASTCGLIDVSVLNPRMLTIPGKGHFFAEPLAKSGAADKFQLYGEIGLEYGPEQWHGKVTGTATS